MIFGTGYPVISGSLGVIALEHSKVNYDFFKPDVMEHISVLNGHRSYPYSRNKSEFQIDVLLCNYTSSTTSSIDKFNDIYQYKNRYFNFIPHNDWSASTDVYGVPIECFMTEFTPYYLSNDTRYDGILITITPRKNTVIVAKVPNGYGTSYGQNYGFTGF